MNFLLFVKIAMSSKDVYIVAAARTPIGKYNYQLANDELESVYFRCIE